MPLTESIERRELHLRRIEMRGYERQDGMFDIEGRIVDTKAYPMPRASGGPDLPVGASLHDMWVRLVVDEHLVVHDAQAVTDVSPYPVCREATATLARVKGLSIAKGWTRNVKERLSGAESCTHLTEMLIPLATVAFQTIVPLLRQRNPAPQEGRPKTIDSCYAYASNRNVVMKRWPQFYTGPAD